VEENRGTEMPPSTAIARVTVTPITKDSNDDVRRTRRNPSSAIRDRPRYRYVSARILSRRDTLPRYSPADRRLIRVVMVSLVRGLGPVRSRNNSRHLAAIVRTLISTIDYTDYRLLRPPTIPTIDYIYLIYAERRTYKQDHPPA